MKIRLFFTTLVVLLGIGIFYVLNVHQNDPLEVIALIQRNINPKDGSITDYAGDINFRGFDSVGYKPIGDKKVRIYFGDLQFDIKEDDLLNEQLKASLSQIGFEIKLSKKTGKYVVLYKGKEVKLRGK